MESRTTSHSESSPRGVSPHHEQGAAGLGHLGTKCTGGPVLPDLGYFLHSPGRPFFVQKP